MERRLWRQRAYRQIWLGTPGRALDRQDLASWTQREMWQSGVTTVCAAP